MSLVLCAPHDELERQAGDERDDYDTAQDRLDPPVDGQQAEDQDTQHQHVQHEARAAADVARVELAGVLGDELLAPFIHLYRLVLHPVIGEKALDVLADCRDKEQVRHEDQDPQSALDEVKEDRVFDVSPEQNAYALRPPNGHGEEEQKRQPEPEDHRGRDLLLGEVLLFAQSYVRGDGQGLHAEPEGFGEREETPDYGEPEELALPGDGIKRFRLNVHVAFGRPDRHPPEVGGAHQDALHYRLPADPHGSLTCCSGRAGSGTAAPGRPCPRCAAYLCRRGGTPNKRLSVCARPPSSASRTRCRTCTARPSSCTRDVCPSSSKNLRLISNVTVYSITPVKKSKKAAAVAAALKSQLP